MSIRSNEEIATRWFAAFNAADLEELLSLYHDNAQHYSPKLKIRLPGTNGFVSGKNELRKWWKDAFDRLPSLQYLPTCFTANKERIFMEYVRKVDNEEDMSVAEVLEIKEDLITASRVYHG